MHRIFVEILFVIIVTHVTFAVSHMLDSCHFFFTTCNFTLRLNECGRGFKEYCTC